MPEQVSLWSVFPQTGHYRNMHMAAWGYTPHAVTTRIVICFQFWMISGQENIKFDYSKEYPTNTLIKVQCYAIFRYTKDMHVHGSYFGTAILHWKYSAKLRRPRGKPGVRCGNLSCLPLTVWSKYLHQCSELQLFPSHYLDF